MVELTENIVVKIEEGCKKKNISWFKKKIEKILQSNMPTETFQNYSGE